MGDLKGIILSFFHGIARSRVSLVGAMITTLTFPFLLCLIIFDAWVHIKNPYLGAFVYMVIGPAFIGGLVMVFVGLFFLKGKEDVRLFTLDYLQGHFADETRFNRVRKLIFLAVLLTSVNFVVFGLLGYSGYHYLESNSFCGQFCHTVMDPEYTAYQNSPHSKVNCVECHIGSGATWFAKSKISGIRQVFAVALNTYPRPIPTPVHGLRPASETCEKCHRPDKFQGDKLRVIDKYAEDKENTHLQTVMLIKIGSAGSGTDKPNGIHWHVAKENGIHYKADSKRMIIPEVTLTKADGSTVIFRSEDAAALIKKAGDKLEDRAMDCIDCHNRPTHIYRLADAAINEEITIEAIDRSLPFIKQQSLKAINQKFPSQAAAMIGIETYLRGWYREHYPAIDQAKLDKSIAGAKNAYAKNVFPDMNLEWGTYVNDIGHGKDFDLGCFRCHDGSHESAQGEVIPSDCTTCHAVLAEDQENPKILQTLRGG
ncbi:cytochrome c3 family protein [Geopsychrobacter electrodiphilus]|uniref:cytochrome c3 family protein n=1 Tax=Geopsychrobacter electrodiphilus TaxID=225196 RepID=UPI00037524D7|nr:NapC/NirT family cytochrome c [Geopsychrobacter electrodiphilus]